MWERKYCNFLEDFDSATERPHGHLVVDLKQNTPEDKRFKSNIFQESHDYQPHTTSESCKDLQRYTKRWRPEVETEDNMPSTSKQRRVEAGSDEQEEVVDAINILI